MNSILIVTWKSLHHHLPKNHQDHCVIPSLIGGLCLNLGSVTNTELGSGGDDVVSARNTVLGNVVAVVDGVSIVRNTVCSSGVDGALVLFTVLGGWLYVVGLSLLKIL